MKCLGCGAHYPDPKGSVMAMTCQCGATMFIGDDDVPLYPASFWSKIANRDYGNVDKEVTFPHIDYYVGRSSHTSQRKEDMIKFLRNHGTIWSWECEECKESVIKRTKYFLEENLYRLGLLHPDLQELVK